MKVIFLDFDGVLNSEQEVRLKHRRRIGRGRLRNGVISWLYWKVWHRLWLASPVRLRELETRTQLWYFSDHCQFCSVACNNVQELLDQVPDARIVVSSVWRSWGMDWLRRILKRNGIDPTRLIDVTGREAGVRGVQIQAWLDRHPEVTDWVIIDDDSDMLPHQLPRFVQTSSRHGLMLKEALAAAEILGGSTAWRADGSISENSGKK